MLLCHAGLPFAAGGYVGVDVFFVISGFLITRLLLNELEARGSISLAGFYGRRAKRLLPLAAVVLIAVMALSRLLLSPVRGEAVSGDIVSSAFYLVNWHFAAQSVDYFSQGLDPSPVQHLWSLAVEEQFYVVWPTLMLLVTWWWRRRGGSVRPALWLAIGTGFAVSLVYCFHLTASSPSQAYFSTPVRAWELGLGGVLALVGGMRMPRAAAGAIAWAGLAAIAAAVVLFDSQTAFPGAAALLPVFGAGAVILAGSSAAMAAAPHPPARLLSLRPVRYVGRISYSWYLWHWPALVFAAAVWGHLGVPAALAVTAASLVPTVLSHHWVEEPFRHSRALLRPPSRALALGVGCSAAAAAAGLLLVVVQPTLHTAPSNDVPGATALAAETLPQKHAAAVRPNPLHARDDRSRMFYDGCLVGRSGTRSNHCVYGNPDGERTLILFGDSHAMQYFPALNPLAHERDLRLITLAKADCPPGLISVEDETDRRRYTTCDIWRRNSLRRILAAARQGPTTVVLSSASDYVPIGRDGRQIHDSVARANALEAGYVATLRRLHRAGMRTAVIKDPPQAPDDIPSCVSQQLRNLERCAFRWVRRPANEFDALATQRVAGAHLIDVSRAICPGDVCRAVIGNALVYRDRAHLSATFARTLEPWIARGLEQSGLI